MKLIKEGKTNWKYIGIVVILAVLVGGGILWWVKKGEVPFGEFPEIKKPEKVAEDETANWETYRNEEYGFEIKYPKEWEEKWEEVWEKDWVAEVGSEESLYFHNPLRCEFGGIRPPCGIVINIYNNPSLLSPGAWTDEYIEGKPIDQDQPSSEDTILINYESLEKIIISGSEGIKFSKRSLRHRVVEKTVILSKVNLIFEFITSEQVSHLPSIFNQMLSTFRFIEKDETADWETYRNEEYGFEIDYPSWVKVSENHKTIEKPYLKSVIFNIPCLTLEEAEIGIVFLEIGIMENFSQLPIEEWIRQNVIEKTEIFGGEEYKVYRDVGLLEEIIISGTKGIRTNLQFNFRAGGCEMIYLPKNSKVYIIGNCQYEAHPVPCTLHPDPETILSTFRFLE